ncbi:MAG TPA: filamentous hemagglutinin N-terminal domain-containing protein, partial [Xenococcaceae cyanobacterium]
MSDSKWRLTWGIIGYCLISLGLLPHPAQGQITTDGTTNTTLTPIDNGVRIDEGDRAGDNLFHSFGEFSVPTGSEAFFNNANDVVNVFSRVTGGNISNIDGLIRANGGANLYLINPAGILFGNNASLQIGGSFYGSTADSILFPDGEFRALDGNNPPLLTVNAPVGLRFRDNPGDIATSADFDDTLTFTLLSVNPGKTIALLGGNLNLDGGLLVAPGGNIQLGGLTAAGDITLTEAGSFNFPEGVARGDINLSNAFSANVTGVAGAISLNGRNITFTGGSSLLGGIEGDLGNATARNITLDATEAISLNQVSNIQNRVNPDAVGNSGNIEVTADSLSITEGSFFSASTLGQGNAGDINLDVNSEFTIDGQVAEESISRIATVVGESAVGDSGKITINAGSLTLSNSALLNTQVFGATENAPGGRGNAGDITISTRENISLDNGFIFSNVQTNQAGTGNGGTVSITANNLTLNTSGIDVTAFGEGNITVDVTNLELIDSVLNAGINPASQLVEAQAGNITIDATEKITIAERNNLRTGIFNSAGDFANIGQLGLVTTNGSAGNITINTQVLEGTGTFNINSVSNGIGNPGALSITATESISLTGELDSNPNISGDFSVTTLNSFFGPLGRGEGADITITTPTLTLSDTLISTSTTGAGNAGNITLNITDNLNLLGASQIQAGSFGSGDAGDIIINADNGNIDLQGATALIGTSVISAGVFAEEVGISREVIEQLGLSLTSAGQGGDIIITANNFAVTNGGDIFTSTVGEATTEGLANSGNIVMNLTGNLIVTNGSNLFTDTFGQGNSGRITIDVAGDVLIEGTNTFISARVLPLPELLQDFDQSRQGGEIQISANNIRVNNSGLVNSSTFALGNAGDITIDTEELTLTEGGAVISGTLGQGDAGNVTINSTETIFISGISNSSGIASGVFTNIEPNAVGEGGDIAITSNNLTLTNGGQLRTDTFGEGNAGNVTLDIADTVLIEEVGETNFSSGISTSVSDTATGNAGDLSVATRELALRDGGLLLSVTEGVGNAGNVTIAVEDTFSISGVGRNEFPTGVNTIVAVTGTGEGGDITITADNLTFTNGGQLRSDTFGMGNAGNVTLNITDTILIDGVNELVLADGSRFVSGISTATNRFEGMVAEGDAGDIDITTSSLELSNGGALVSGSDAVGDGGTININA